jgi:prophage regulatory protein
MSQSKVERIARRYCTLINIDPDKECWNPADEGGHCFVKAWELQKNKVKEFLLLLDICSKDEELKKSSVKPSGLDAKESSNLFIKLPELMRLTTMSSSTIYLRMNKGLFPKPYKISARSSAWKREDIEEWLENRMLAPIKTNHQKD